ncbi:MAG: phytanoyl-CoA dioxygenase family protein [Asticcacaulis sp.]
MSASQTFATDGAVHFRAALSDAAIEPLRTFADQALGQRPGARLSAETAFLAELLSAKGLIGRFAAELAGPDVRPVRFLLFDKSDASNWAVPWHQDRTIAVKARVDVPGYGPWSTKDGRVHVEPPVDVLSRMVTLRVHLDHVDAHNAPLKVALGTHTRGVVLAHDVRAVIEAQNIEPCLAEAGDIWAYSTLILHASDRADPGRRRRVLHIDYADFDLPGGLAWLGV